MKRIIQIILTGLLSLGYTLGIPSLVNAQSSPKTICPDSLVADFNTLVTYLEQTHPDPYSGFGGRAFFYITADALRERLASGQYSTAEFAALANGFMAHIQDGHTTLSLPGNQKDVSGRRLKAPLTFKCIPDGLIFSRLPDKYAPQLGSRLVAINGIGLDSLLTLVARLTPCENKYGAYAKFTNSYYLDPILPQLFPTAETLIFQAQDALGNLTALTFPFNDSPEKYAGKSVSLSGNYPGNLDKSYLDYGFVDPGKRIMLFRVKSIMARENFAVTLKGNWDGALQGLENHYKWTLQKEIPRKQSPQKRNNRKQNNAAARIGSGDLPVVDTAAALAGVPSFSGLFYNLLCEMKRNNSSTLIIDLRDNGGGWTPITLPTLYMMYGDAYLQTDMGTNFYKRLSPLLLRKENSSLEKYGTLYGRELKMGDYVGQGKWNRSPEEERKAFFNSALCAIPESLPKDGEPIYTPKDVFVITDAGTFSAAFHYAFYLWKMGATVVGIPCSQAPNTYMETTPFTLPHTGLSGGISNALQVFLPGNDPRAKTFYPNLMPQYEDYVRYQFSPHTELLWLIDRIKR